MKKLAITIAVLALAGPANAAWYQPKAVHCPPNPMMKMPCRR